MKIVHSCWTKPTFHQDQNYENSRGSGGWVHIKYLWLSIAFSCHRAKEVHVDIEMITDNRGYDLIKKLSLPYSNISNQLEHLNDSNYKLWVLGKFSAFKSQKSGFIHIDNDVYLWEPIFTKSHPNFLITQSRIPITENYKHTLQDVFDKFAYIPECIVKRKIPENFFVANAGIVGGNNIDFFQEYCYLADEFVNRNLEVIENVNLGLFNTILDEYLFTCLAEERGIKVEYLINTPLNESFKRIVRLNLVPFIDKYIHLYGLLKQNIYVCEHLELRFRYEFPKNYKSVKRVLDELYPFGEREEKKSIDKWKRVEKAFAILYKTTIDEFVKLRVKLRDGVKITSTEINKGEIQYFLDYGNDQSLSLLKEMDETLIYFQEQVCINELIEELQNEGFIYDGESYVKYQLKLIDFVTEKILVDNIVEFVE